MDIVKEMELPVGARSLVPMRSFVKRCLSLGGVEGETARRVHTALDEALSPALVLNEGERKGHLTIRIDINETRLRVTLQDNTDGAELSNGAEQEILKEALKPRREVGYSLLRRVMDEIRYSYRRGFENELELIKFL
ncbi:MAG: ATP-binding protein [Planctomycetes bacterium]|nr:ATP-binding protein [Planctomycetota bacterium]